MRYDAFISYRHAELDMFVAKKVHKGLETFKVPKAVQKTSGKKSIKRVFRDQEELPIGSDLNDNISTALTESEFLIVICSPRAKESYWVEREITSFIELHDRQHVLAVLVEGEPDESFPEILLTDEDGNPVEPLAADVRGSSKREIEKKLKTELMRLCAVLLYCSYDDLKQRHKERRMKKILTLVTAAGITVSALGIAFGVYNANMAAQIQENYVEKQRNQAKYLAEVSGQLLESGDRRAATLVAMSALPDLSDETNTRPYVAEAEYALSKAVYAYTDDTYLTHERVLSHELPVISHVYDASGERITSVDSAGTIYVWEAATGKNLFKKSAGFDDAGYAQHVNCAQCFEDKIAWVTGDGITVCDFEGKELFNQEFGYVSYALEASDKSYVAVVADEKLLVFDIANLKLAAEYEKPSEALKISRLHQINEDSDSVIFSLSQSDEEATSAVCAVASIAHGSLKQIETAENYLIDGHLTKDGKLITVSCDENVLLESGDIPCKIEAFSLQEEVPQKLWDYTLTLSFLETHNSEIIVVSGDMATEPFVVVAAGSNIYCFDPATGELRYRTGFPGAVEKVWTNSNGYVIVASADGTINIVNGKTGENYNSNAVKVNRTIQDAILKNGRVATRASYDSEIVLMGYITPACLLEKKSFEETINDLQSTEDGSLLAIINHNDYKDVKVDFYDTKDDSLKDSVTLENDGVYNFAGFIDNDRFALIDRKGNLSVYSLSAKKTETASPRDISISFSFDISKDRKNAVLMLSRGVVVFDLDNVKATLTEFEDKKLEFIKISSEGNVAYGFDDEDRFFRLDFETGTFDYDYPEITVPVNSTDKESYMAVSADGKLVGICCRDGFFRVLDVSTKTVIHEIPFKCNSYAYTDFSNDGNLVYLQGNDYIFKVYDLTKEEFVHIDSEQIPILSSVKETDTELVLDCGSYLSVLDKDSLSSKLAVDYGRAFCSSSGKIYASRLSKNSPEISIFHYASLEELIAKAKEQFPEESLSDYEKIKYHVE